MDTGRLYIPNLNAIPLFPKEQLPSDNYSIKYEQGDFTCIQLFCIESKFEVGIYLYDVSGKLISTFTVDTSIVNADTSIIRFYTALIRFSEVSEGGYYIGVNLKNNVGDTCSYYSPCIDVRQNHRKTFLIEYFNSVNANNVLFNNGTSFALRIEGGFLPKSYIPKVQETIYQNQQVEFNLLESDVRDGGSKACSPLVYHHADLRNALVRLEIVVSEKVVAAKHRDWIPPIFLLNSLLTVFFFFLMPSVKFSQRK